ncbi:MAG TPA: TetR/AcrR family transcriptional regulator [Acidobacteriota bacterium]|jgi:AcrR family transcriptional regulator
MGRQHLTRDRILQSAIDLFWEKGYANTGMAELLRRAKVNSGSFYYFFKSKEDLLLAVLDRYAEMLQPVLLVPVWKKTRDPVSRIFGLLARYRELILMTDCTYGCPIGRLALEIDPEQREVHKKIAMNFDGWADAVQSCLDDAGERLPPELDRRKLSRFVLTVMEGGVMQSRSHRSVKPFDMAVEQLRDYFSRIMSTPIAKTPRKPTKKKPTNRRHL